LSTTNPIRNALRLNSGLREKKKTGTNDLSNGTTVRTFECYLICSVCVQWNKPEATYTFQCMAFTHTQKAIMCSQTDTQQHMTDVLIDLLTIRCGEGGKTAPSERKNTASTHLQQKKLETVNYTATLKTRGLEHVGPLRVKATVCRMQVGKCLPWMQQV
jgi:hypothetical protein